MTTALKHLNSALGSITRSRTVSRSIPGCIPRRIPRCLPMWCLLAIWPALGTLDLVPPHVLMSVRYLNPTWQTLQHLVQK